VTARTSKHFLVAVVVAGAAAAAAQAQDPRNDPAVGSPAGVVYEIPLEAARRDAAPSTRGSRSDTVASPIRSENHFGSSSQVPGVPGVPADDGSRADRDDGEGGPGSRGGGGSGSDTGGRGASSGDGDPPATVANAERLIASGAPIASQPSGMRAYLLLALGILVAAGIAVASRRTAR
jgi:hypothetical protein